jgi:magnesium transporter
MIASADTYGDTTFRVLRTAFMVDGHITLGETEIFVGRGYVISFRHGASAFYTRRGSAQAAGPAVFAFPSTALAEDLFHLR